MKKDDCIFCKIGAGEIPVNAVYEDDKCIAFPDMEPLMPVHTLIIPREHYSDIADDVPEELLGHLFKWRAVAHVIIGDMVNLGRLFGNAHTWVDAHAVFLFLPIGIDLDIRDLDDAVLRDVEPRRLNVKEDDGALKFQFKFHVAVLTKSSWASAG